MNKYLRNLNRIEVIITNACTGRCKHCSQGDHINSLQSVKSDTVVKAVEDIVSAYSINSLMTFGGEPLLFADTVCDIQECAARLGIPKRQIITNGFFSKDKNVIETVAENIVKSGANDILLSVDAFHQETIPIAYVKIFSECVKNNGGNIRLQPAWLVSVNDENPFNVKTKALLDEFSYLDITVGSGNVIFPEGNALIYLKKYFKNENKIENPYKDDPCDITSVSIEPDGKMLEKCLCKYSALDILEAYTPS